MLNAELNCGAPHCVALIIACRIPDDAAIHCGCCNADAHFDGHIIQYATQPSVVLAKTGV